MWPFTRRTAALPPDPRRPGVPAPLPRVLFPFDHDDDEYSGDEYSTRRRRRRPLHLAVVALVLFGAWLVLPLPMSDASPRVAAVPRDSVVAAEPITLIAVPFVASDTIFADTAFLSDSAIIAAAAEIEAETKAKAAAARRAAAAAADKQADDAVRPLSSETSATDAATEQLTQARLAGVLSRSLPPIDSVLVGLRGGSRAPAPR